MNPVTTEEVLRCWRLAMCFADSVRLSTGEKGAVVGKDAVGSLTVILDGRMGKNRKVQVELGELFPGWWPDGQFTQKDESRRRSLL